MQVLLPHMAVPSPQKIGDELPENPYGYSKYAMDNIAKEFSMLNPDIRIIGLKFFNVYGPKEYFKAKTSSMVVQLGHQILSGQSPRLFENSNKILRDFIFIEDVIQANIKACRSSISGIFNVGSGIPRSFQDIADILQKELGTNYPTEYFTNPYDGYQMHTQADISLTKSHLDFEPWYTLEMGIKSYIPEIKNTHNLPLD